MKKPLTLLFILAFLVSSQCGPGKTVYSVPEKGAVLRLTDLITPNNINETPFYKLEERFPYADEDLTGKGQKKPELSSAEYTIWAFTTGKRILGRQDKPEPQNMTLRTQNKEISSVE